MSILITSQIKNLKTYKSFFLIAMSLCCWSALSKISSILPNKESASSLTIKSEKMQINTKQQTYHYLNHVEAKHNNNLLKANSLEVLMKQSIVYQLKAQGTPAKLKLYDKKNKTFLYATANKIIAYPEKNQLVLIEQASLKEGNKNLTAEKIIINTKNLNVSTVSSGHQLSTLVLKKS